MNKDQPPYTDLIKVESIPPLSATATQLLVLAVNPDVEIEDISRVIERDPPLSARLLGIANSAFYSPRQPVTTVKSAIVSVLGLNMVRNIAFGLALTGGLSTTACPRFDVTEYWIMALGTADLASGLARATTLADAPDPDETYLSGLLHNLGELLMVHLWPYEMNEALAKLDSDPDTTLIEQELALIGVDHWAVGAFLARHWQLPEFVARNIEALDERNTREDARSSVMLLRAARRWIAGVALGRPDALRITGVDETYCEYRSTSFLDRFEGLSTLARSMH